MNRVKRWILKRLGLIPLAEIEEEFGVTLDGWHEPDEPDFDEAQEWEDFDPSSTMEAMYGGDDDY